MAQIERVFSQKNVRGVDTEERVAWERQSLGT